MPNHLEEALTEFEKSEKTAKVKIYNHKFSDFRIKLNYFPKSLVSININFPNRQRKFNYTDNYLVSSIYDIRGSNYILVFEKNRETIEKNYFYFTYLEEDGLGLDPRYIIKNYKEIVYTDKESYLAKITKNGKIRLFSEISLSDQNKIESIRLYHLNGKKLEKFGKNELDFYLEVNF